MRMSAAVSVEHFLTITNEHKHENVVYVRLNIYIYMLMHIHDFTDSNYGHHSNMLSQVCIPNIQYLPAVMRTIFVIRTTIKQRVFFVW